MLSKMKRSTVRSTSTPPQAKNEMSKSVIPNEQANSKSTPLFEQQAEMCNILGILILISTSRFWLFTTRLWTRAVTFAIAVQSTTETFVNRSKKFNNSFKWCFLDIHHESCDQALQAIVQVAQKDGCSTRFAHYCTTSRDQNSRPSIMHHTFCAVAG